MLLGIFLVGEQDHFEDVSVNQRKKASPDWARGAQSQIDTYASAGAVVVGGSGRESEKAEVRSCRGGRSIYIARRLGKTGGPSASYGKRPAS